MSGRQALVVLRPVQPDTMGTGQPRRVLLARGSVLAVRRGDIPGGGPAAAILRYAV